MTTTATLEEKFQAAVKAIQHLPPDGLLHLVYYLDSKKNLFIFQLRSVSTVERNEISFLWSLQTSNRRFF